MKYIYIYIYYRYIIHTYVCIYIYLSVCACGSKSSRGKVISKKGLWQGRRRVMTGATTDISCNPGAYRWRWGWRWPCCWSAILVTTWCHVMSWGPRNVMHGLSQPVTDLKITTTVMFRPGLPALVSTQKSYVVFQDHLPIHSSRDHTEHVPEFGYVTGT